MEYALEAINNASSTLGILAKDGVVLAADKMVTSKLLDHGRSKEKLYKVVCTTRRTGPPHAPVGVSKPLLRVILHFM